MHENRFGRMLFLVIAFLQYLFDRVDGSRSSAEELLGLRRRLAAMDGIKTAGPEEVQTARKLRSLREILGAALGPLDACSHCVRPRSQDWQGGHCCSGNTADLFTDDELAALKLSGTSGSKWRAPHTVQNGCAFRGPSGCSISPAHRPSLCLRYSCYELQQELDRRDDGPRLERLCEEIRQTAEQFAVLRQARLDARLFDLLSNGLLKTCKRLPVASTKERKQLR